MRYLSRNSHYKKEEPPGCYLTPIGYTISFHTLGSRVILGSLNEVPTIKINYSEMHHTGLSLNFYQTVFIYRKTLTL